MEVDFKIYIFSFIVDILYMSNTTVLGLTFVEISIFTLLK